MLHCSRNVTIMLKNMSIVLNDFLIMLTLAQVLTQLHFSTCASLSLGNRDMTTDAVVGLVLPVVCSLRLLLSVSNKPVGWGGSGVRTNACEGPPVRAVSGRGNIAVPWAWDAGSRKSEQLEPEKRYLPPKKGNESLLRLQLWNPSYTAA